MSTTVREATVHDLDELAILFDAYRRFYEQPEDLQGARQFLEDRLQPGESVVFIAEGPDGSPQGFAQLYPNFSSVRAARTWLLNDLFVAPEARRQGVAEALLGAAAAFARARGAARMTLSTSVANTTAQNLYERLGWQRQEGFIEYALDL